MKLFCTAGFIKTVPSGTLNVTRGKHVKFPRILVGLGRNNLLAYMYLSVPKKSSHIFDALSKVNLATEKFLTLIDKETNSRI